MTVQAKKPAKEAVKAKINKTKHDLPSRMDFRWLYER